MTRICCLAGVDTAIVPMFCRVLEAAGEPPLATLGRLEVSELGKLAPALLVCDVDGIEVDAIELLRQIRFVLPECVIAVYTGVMERTWDALRNGCYTDPRFAA